MPTTRRRIVAEAWLLNAVNPKGTAFMLAVVPQFLTPAEPLVPQYLVIAATLVVHRPRRQRRLRRARRAPARRCCARRRAVRAVNRVFGGLFVALGVVLATFKRA